APTTTTVTSSLSPSPAQQPVTFTATVSAGPGVATPTGSVQFLVDGSPATGQLSLNGSGQASFTTSSLGAGPHSITANYTSNSAAFATSGRSVTQTVNPPPPSVSVAFGPGGEVMEVVNAAGVLMQLDAFGAHVLGGGARAASVAFGPFGEVLLITYQSGE